MFTKQSIYLYSKRGIDIGHSSWIRIFKILRNLIVGNLKVGKGRSPPFHSHPKYTTGQPTLSFETSRTLPRGKGEFEERAGHRAKGGNPTAHKSSASGWAQGHVLVSEITAPHSGMNPTH